MLSHLLFGKLRAEFRELASVRQYLQFRLFLPREKRLDHLGTRELSIGPPFHQR